MKKNTFIAILTFILAISVSCKKDMATSIKFDKNELKLAQGNSAILTLDIQPLSTTEKFTWSSSNPNVALVVEGDNRFKGVVTAKSAGTTTISVKTKNSNLVASCTVTVINVDIEMIVVIGGNFIMGCTDDECSSDGREEPAHQVTLTGYKIGKYEVTQKQWEAVMGYNPSFLKDDNLPVGQVSWLEVQTFITKLNEFTGKSYRLPTEAQWEFAARGGNKSLVYKYSGSNNVDEVAWYVNNSSEITHQVGTKAPNELGIYDMTGNVWEFCSDWYGKYSEYPQTDPTGPPYVSVQNVVIRGGGCRNSSFYCRVLIRSGWEINMTFESIGFRLVLR